MMKGCTHFKKGQEKDPRNLILNNITSVSDKFMERVPMDCISAHVENKVVGNSQHKFTNVKPKPT